MSQCKPSVGNELSSGLIESMCFVKTLSNNVKDLFTLATSPNRLTSASPLEWYSNQKAFHQVGHSDFC